MSCDDESKEEFELEEEFKHVIVPRIEEELTACRKEVEESMHHELADEHTKNYWLHTFDNVKAEILSGLTKKKRKRSSEEGEEESPNASPQPASPMTLHSMLHICEMPEEYVPVFDKHFPHICDLEESLCYNEQWLLDFLLGLGVPYSNCIRLFKRLSQLPKEDFN